MKKNNLELFNKIKQILINNFYCNNITEVIAKEITDDQRHRRSIGILKLGDQVYDIYTRNYEIAIRPTHFEGINILWLIMASNLLMDTNYVPQVYEEKKTTIDKYYKKYVDISKENNFILKSSFENQNIYFEFISKDLLKKENSSFTFDELDNLKI